MTPIEQVVNQFRNDLLIGERQAASRMVREYAAVLEAIDARLNVMLHANLAQTLTLEWLYERNRLEALKLQVAQELQHWTEPLQLTLDHLQGQAIQLGSQSGQALLETAGLAPEQVQPFLRLQPQVLETLTGQLQPRSPVGMLLNAIAPEGAELAGKALIQAAGLGKSPRDAAKDIRKTLGTPLSRALTISRTETIRAFRLAHLATYQANSDVVVGWRWSTSLSGRSCIGCIVMHGSFHPLDEVLSDHPSGRCAMIPVLDPALGFEEPKLTDSQEWFDALSVSEQGQHLHPDALAAYRKGEVSFTDLMQTRQDRVWGDTVGPKSLKDLLPPKAARSAA